MLRLKYIESNIFGENSPMSFPSNLTSLHIHKLRPPNPSLNIPSNKYICPPELQLINSKYVVRCVCSTATAVRKLTPRICMPLRCPFPPIHHDIAIQYAIFLPAVSIAIVSKKSPPNFYAIPMQMLTRSSQQPAP